MRSAPTLLLIPLLAACGLSLPGRDAPAPAPDVAVTLDPGDSVTHPQARPGDAQTDPQTAAPAAVQASAPAGADGYLGETLAGLGAPADRGLWLTTGLVTAPRPGRVVAASGRAVAVELRPSGAAATAGSQISLQAMQALGLSLGDLATLAVYAD
ncbi:MAG: D-galactarate dehydratase [Rhodobacteraceae bacterium]|nr:D-galactarate dehydratase [Paracoccaceae bacterium]